MSLLKLDPHLKPAFDGPKTAQQLISKLTAAKPVVAAYLFGSAAVGRNTADSDLDILLVVPDGSDIKKYHQFVNTAHFSPVAVDWIIKTASDFEKDQKIGGIAMVAAQTGIKLTCGSKYGTK